jgi:hypothetical protein
MTANNFNAIWSPRIGPQATAQLRRSGYFALVLLPTAVVAAIVCSILAGNGSVVGAVVAAAVAVVCFVTWLQSRFKLANELSEWFGADVRWHEMPRMRTADFDTWCQRRGLQSRDRHA